MLLLLARSGGSAGPAPVGRRRKEKTYTAVPLHRRASRSTVRETEALERSMAAVVPQRRPERFCFAAGSVCGVNVWRPGGAVYSSPSADLGTARWSWQPGYMEMTSLLYLSDSGLSCYSVKWRLCWDRFIPHILLS